MRGDDGIEGGEGGCESRVLYLVEDRRHGTRGIWELFVPRWKGGRCLEIFAAYLPFCRLYSWLEICWPF